MPTRLAIRLSKSRAHQRLAVYSRSRESPLQFFLAQLGVGVEDTHAHLFGLLKDLLARPRRNAVRNLCSVRLVVHEEGLELVDSGYPVLEEAAGEHEARLLIGTVADGNHGALTPVLVAHRRVYPTGFSPRRLDADEALGLEADEFVLPLLDDDLMREGVDRLAGHSFQIMGFLRPTILI